MRFQIEDSRIQIADLIRGRGPLTVAAFMDLALYHPDFGYYARATRRSGRAGDFFTSVDVGPLFGELLEIQIAEMFGILESRFSTCHFDLVEAGAGDGRLSADILRAMRRRDGREYERTRLHLVEASSAARRAQRETLGDVAGRLESSSADLPDSFEGVLLANELLDALPVHQVVMRDEGLREVYLDEGRLVEGPPSTPALAEYLKLAGVTLESGWRVEINLRAVDWVRRAARRLRRGFVVLVDYGHEARELYSSTHAAGTLTTFTRHTMDGAESQASEPAWMRNPGGRDITSHVDFTSVRAAAEAEGLTTLGFLDQTYFLLGLVSGVAAEPASVASGADTSSAPAKGENDLKRRLALKTLLMPGGLGSTMKVLIFGRDVAALPLKGFSFRMRVT